MKWYRVLWKSNIASNQSSTRFLHLNLLILTFQLRGDMYGIKSNDDVWALRLFRNNWGWKCRLICPVCGNQGTADANDGSISRSRKCLRNVRASWTVQKLDLKLNAFLRILLANQSRKYGSLRHGIFRKKKSSAFLCKISTNLINEECHFCEKYPVSSTK